MSAIQAITIRLVPEGPDELARGQKSHVGRDCRGTHFDRAEFEHHHRALEQKRETQWVLLASSQWFKMVLCLAN
jgi:hypothetical protein